MGGLDLFFGFSFEAWEFRDSVYIFCISGGCLA